MIAIIAFVLAMFTGLFPVKSEAQLFIAVMAPESDRANAVGDGINCTGRAECSCMGCFDLEVYIEAGDEFTRLFNATEVKWAKNGRLMVKGANSKSFKFAPKGK